MKIAIIGSPGSGKSTLAIKLHERLSIPVYHLDQYFWLPGWQRPDRAIFEQKHNTLCDKDTWIIEGMATRYMAYRCEKADVIIFLDIPWWRCIYRIFKRAITYYGHVYISSAPECPERLPDREFLWYIVRFHWVLKKQIRQLLHQHANNKHVFIVRNQDDIDRMCEANFF